MDWWLWIVAGLALLVVEITTPGGFIFLFFGIAAMCVGVLTRITEVDYLWQQALIFGALAVLSMLLFRRRLVARLATKGAGHVVDGMVGDTAVATEPLAVGATGKAEYRGTVWSAHNAGPVPIAVGQRCRVVRVAGLTLWLESH